MCSTSCALTETPAAYIWYKNREFLYEDWSPWYQELVHSEEGVTYSCAIKGYEDLRAPDVSVDSVSSTCFTVTYAKGRMCSYQQKSEDESCSITYPTEVYVIETPIGTSLKLSCNSSCLMVDPQTAYRWHWNKKIFTDCEKQDMMSFCSQSETVSCAVKGHEDLFSDEICTDNTFCWMVNYPSRRICTLEGSSVNISSDYYFNGWRNTPKKWHKIKRHGEVTDGGLTEDDNRVEKYDNMKDEHTLTIHELKKSDSGEYAFVFNIFEVWTPFHVPGVILLVTGLKVTMAPSAEVTEGQRVTLTCSTSCPLTDNNIYIWYLNGRRLTLPESPNKHLILDPVGFQHAGNYSCVVPTPQNISSSEENLTVNGVYGQYGPMYPGVNSICALKGLSVDLPCSRKLASSPKWYIRHSNDDYVWKELYADGENTLYNLTEESKFTLRINNLSESDTKFYCCKENTDDDYYCKSKRTELYVTDLQVKVIPTTENQTVTLMCSTSCALTETPAAYIWYKNREFLYEDWSPWYQELVQSEEGVTYSYSVSSTCFTVTYAKGRMCSYQQKSEDESCSITYPTEVYVVETPIGTSLKLSCNSSCLMVDPQTAYRWHWNKELLTVCENQDIISFDTHSETISCAVKGHEDLFSDEICTDNNSCWTVNYPSRRICALEGSSVNISSNYYVNGQNTRTKKWHKIKRHGEVTDGGLTEDDNRVEKYDNMKDEHTLTIHELKKSDSGEYAFVFNNFEVWRPFHVPGVILLVTGLKVTMAPSAEVTEGQRVTLTCSTSCPLTDNNIYIWYLNGRRLTLPESPNKHLILDPVGFQHAGNYSCVVPTPQNISSSEENLTVNVDMLNETIALQPTNPEAKAEPAGQQEDIL
ncbi:hypothetical protein Q8A73_003030 [Channa argus]|nr:hypothetical protein Q8A73_003030 [Channa argus]